MSHEILETELRRVLSETCRDDLSSIALDADLVHELGMDSMAGLRLLAVVEKRFEVRFPDERLGEFRTLRQLLEFIRARDSHAGATYAG